MSFMSNVVRFCHLEAGEITNPQSNLVSRSQNGFVFVVSRPESCLLHVGKPVGQRSSLPLSLREVQSVLPKPLAPRKVRCARKDRQWSLPLSSQPGVLTAP